MMNYPLPIEFSLVHVNSTLEDTQSIHRIWGSTGAVPAQVAVRACLRCVEAGDGVTGSEAKVNILGLSWKPCEMVNFWR